ncbi:MAG TPA: glycosyltransferase family 4 protein [Candidatus Nanoarchaeia archaeon]|nr:glycosyltransferase family 4 protein [Candidatus Nanoarchaeia archaeon]
MNIALLAAGMSWGKKESLAITVRQYAHELLRRGHTVAIISERKGAAAEEIEDGVHLFRGSGGIFFSYVAAFYRARKLGRFDVIHGFSAAPVFVLRSLLCKLVEPRARVVHTLKSYSRSALGNYCTWLLNFVHHVTVPTAIYKSKLRFVREKRISVVRSHIDLAAFRAYSAAEKKEVRAKLGLPAVPVLFYYGATWTDKGVDDLVFAVRQLLDQHIACFLLIAPRYEIEKDLKTLIMDTLGSNARIDYGISVVDYLNAADVCVLPYKSICGTEGNPSCLLEAMACKTAVVTTSILELREIVVDDVLMAIPGDCTSLAHALSSVLNNAKLRERLAEHAQIAQFDVRIVAEQFLKIYESK